jgi:FtsP/CotA-like multicopper oxidase with cupredoxin domain
MHSQRLPSSPLPTGMSWDLLQLAPNPLIDNRYHTVAPVLNHFIGVHVSSALINGLGRYQDGPVSPLAVVDVERGKRYRLRLVGLSCHSYFTFSIDYHNLTVIEADGEETEPLLVDSLQVLPGQRYSVVLEANQPVDNYWLRALSDIANATYNGGQNLAILRYKGAPAADPTRNGTHNFTMPLLETNLHALINPGAPGVPGYGNADINLMMVMNITNNGIYSVNNVTFLPPTVPVLLQILSGVQDATDLLPSGSVYVLERNKVVELTMFIAFAGGPVSSTHI